MSGMLYNSRCVTMQIDSSNAQVHIGMPHNLYVQIHRNSSIEDIVVNLYET
eukprot:TRINITY_DN13444_c0_g1_i1.p1 TRINITY_DN13444_c0_g1~~TRINITY_DN13444_c0_g1_i1.p1  ORF type:complete len:51 (-),score=6.91 TRINITY_DN13444_c0_g1_i1:53-205(-)